MTIKQIANTKEREMHDPELTTLLSMRLMDGLKGHIYSANRLLVTQLLDQKLEREN